MGTGMNTWQDMKWMSSGDLQVVEDKLDDLLRSGKGICPSGNRMFDNLNSVAVDDVRVVILGQDPYSDPKLATGHAFSIPDNIPLKEWPPTLINIMTEYCKDLGLPAPTSGNLMPWVKQGVLLWNVIPTCTEGQSLSHDWTEYKLLGHNKQLIEFLNSRGVLFVFLGSKARAFAKYVKQPSEYLEYSHPSPRSAHASKHNYKHPFLGSRMFSTINDKLVKDLGLDPINWRLP